VKDPHRDRPLIADFALDYVELYVADVEAQARLWRDRYGFAVVGAGGGPGQGFRSVVMGQGPMRVVLTGAVSDEHAAHLYVLAHGDGVANIAMRTHDVRAAFQQILDNGGQVVAAPVEHVDDDVRITATVRGFGDVTHTLVQRDGGGPGLPAGCHPLSGPEASGTPPVEEEVTLLDMDHFAVCVNIGELDPTIDFYRDAFGFEQTFEERIVVGSQAMLSKVAQSPSRSVTFTVIQPDPAADPGQIDEFLKNHGGAGVQHVAFASDDVVRAVRALSARGVEFLPTPDTYYAVVAGRVVPERHSVDRLRELNILVDQDHAGQLFQIFTRSTHERQTLFFEVIERCGAVLFGSSNIRALYEAVEIERLKN
jgi:4-hydroxymandelate synthase